MTTTLGGDDPAHDFPPEDKDRLERELRSKARDRVAKGGARGRKRLLAQAIEIPRRKSSRAHQP